MNTLPFYIFLFIHLVSLVVGFGAVIVIDSFGLVWLLFKSVDLKFLVKVANITQRLIWLGWCGLVFSGIFLITMKGYIDNLTQIKLFLVAMVGLNGVFLHVIKKSMEKYMNSKNLPAKLQFRIGLSSFISQLGWWGAMLIGFMHRQWMHKIPWPSNSGPYMIAILLLISVIALTGEFVTRKSKI